MFLSLMAWAGIKAGDSIGGAYQNSMNSVGKGGATGVGTGIQVGSAALTKGKSMASSKR